MSANNIKKYIDVVWISGIVLAVYSLGLNGPFILDDFENLGTLDAFKERGLSAYFASVPDGGLGRPVAFLTFLVNAESWPDSTFEFKLFNVFIHLLSLLLVYVISLKISERFNYKNKRLFVVAVSILWSLNLAQTSAVLYVVQRMVLLCGFFTLATVYFYLKYVADRKPYEFKQFLISVVFTGTLFSLSVLSKENGVLTALYLGLVIVYFSKHKDDGIYQKVYRSLFCILPIVLIAAYFVFTWDVIETVYKRRDFTLSERLLTQPEILLHYIKAIIIPSQSSTGLFFDDYVPVASLFDIHRFVVPSIVHVILLVLAIYYRKSLFAFGVFWFYLGHLLESTFVPLELYFEHRNYIPSFGVVLSVVSILMYLVQTRSLIAKNLISLYIIAVVGLSAMQSRLWNNEGALLGVWAEQRPNSIRANIYLNNYWIKTKQEQKILSRYDSIIDDVLDNFALSTIYAMQMCEMQHYDRVNDDLRGALIEKSKYGSSFNGIHYYLSKLVDSLQNDKCGKLSLDDLYKVLVNLSENTKYQYPTSIGSTLYQISYVESKKGYLSQAIRYSDLANYWLNDPDVALQQAYWLASAGLIKEAFYYSEYAKYLAEIKVRRDVHALAEEFSSSIKKDQTGDK